MIDILVIVTSPGMDVKTLGQWMRTDTLLRPGDFIKLSDDIRRPVAEYRGQPTDQTAVVYVEVPTHVHKKLAETWKPV